MVIATRHDSHADLVCRALRAGKHVFVEKPLALDDDELAEIEICYQAQIATGHRCHLMVGFNRRFAPHLVKAKALLAPISAPKTMIMTVNAGAIPADHWTQNRKLGGGRIIGEGCHFVDLMRHMAGAAITDVQARSIGGSLAGETPEDKASITLAFADGSIGTLHYFANGAKSFPKERLEIFADGRILQFDNFKRLTGHGWLVAVQTPIAVRVAVQAPATVVRRQKMPSQNAIAIIPSIFHICSSILTTLSSQKVIKTPPPTTSIAAIRATQR